MDVDKEDEDAAVGERSKPEEVVCKIEPVLKREVEEEDDFNSDYEEGAEDAEVNYSQWWRSIEDDDGREGEEDQDPLSLSLSPQNQTGDVHGKEADSDEEEDDDGDDDENYSPYSKKKKASPVGSNKKKKSKAKVKKMSRREMEEERKAKNRERMRQRREKMREMMTDEERKEYLKKEAEKKRERRQSSKNIKEDSEEEHPQTKRTYPSDEDRLEARRARDREEKRMKRQMARESMTEEERKERLMKEAEKKRERRQSSRNIKQEHSEEEEGLEEERNLQEAKPPPVKRPRPCLSDEDRLEARRARDREEKRLKRQKARASMTEEERKEYLRKEAEKKREKRAQQLAKTNPEKFLKMKQRERAPRSEGGVKKKRVSEMTEEERRQHKIENYFAYQAKVAEMRDKKPLTEEEIQARKARNRAKWESMDPEKKAAEKLKLKEKYEKRKEELKAENGMVRVDGWKNLTGFEKLPLNCEVCGAKVKVYNLHRHYLHVHGVEEERYVCWKQAEDASCGKSFSSRTYWLQHMTKREEKSRGWHSCGGGFLTREELDWRRVARMNFPMGDEPARRIRIEQMRMKEEEVKVAKKLLKQGNPGGRRAIIENGLMTLALSCDVCGKSLSLASLKRHYDLVHGLKEEEFQCWMECGKSFGSRQYLVSHMEKAHGMKEFDRERLAKWNTNNPEGLKVVKEKIPRKRKEQSEGNKKQASKIGEWGRTSWNSGGCIISGSNNRAGSEITAASSSSNLHGYGEQRTAAWNSAAVAYAPAPQDLSGGDDGGMMDDEDPSSCSYPDGADDRESSSEDEQEETYNNDRISVGQDSQDGGGSVEYHGGVLATPSSIESNSPPQMYNIYSQYAHFMQPSSSSLPTPVAPAIPTATLPPPPPPSISKLHHQQQQQQEEWAAPPLPTTSTWHFLTQPEQQQQQQPSSSVRAQSQSSSMDQAQARHSRTPKDKQQQSTKSQPRSKAVKDSVCDECGEAMNKLYITLHKRTKHNKHFLNGQCLPCGGTFKRFRIFWDHFKEAHPELCGELPVIGRKPRGVNLRPRTKKVPPGVCDTCGMTFRSVYYLRRHQRNRHGEGANPENYLSCHVCGKLLKSNQILIAHIKMMHPEAIQPPGPLAEGEVRRLREGLKCLKCMADGFRIFPQLCDHVKEAHPDFYFPCQYCEAMRYSLKGLNYHLGQYCKGVPEEERQKLIRKDGGSIERQRLNCEVCGQSLALFSLKKHYNQVHGVQEEPYECWRDAGGCGKTFHKREYWTIHMESICGINVDFERVAKMHSTDEGHGAVKYLKEKRRRTEEDGDGDGGGKCNKEWMEYSDDDAKKEERKLKPTKGGCYIRKTPRKTKAELGKQRWWKSNIWRKRKKVDANESQDDDDDKEEKGSDSDKEKVNRRRSPRNSATTRKIKYKYESDSESEEEEEEEDKQSESDTEPEASSSSSSRKRNVMKANSAAAAAGDEEDTKKKKTVESESRDKEGEEEVVVKQEVDQAEEDFD